MSDDTLKAICARARRVRAQDRDDRLEGEGTASRAYARDHSSTTGALRVSPDKRPAAINLVMQQAELFARYA
jgi:hypothetical protein